MSPAQWRLSPREWPEARILKRCESGFRLFGALQELALPFSIGDNFVRARLLPGKLYLQREDFVFGFTEPDFERSADPSRIRIHTARSRTARSRTVLQINRRSEAAAIEISHLTTDTGNVHGGADLHNL